MKNTISTIFSMAIIFGFFLSTQAVASVAPAEIVKICQQEAIESEASKSEMDDNINACLEERGFSPLAKAESSEEAPAEEVAKQSNESE